MNRKDATLKELSELVKEVNEESRRRDAKFSFRSVFQTGHGQWRTKDLGMVFNARHTKDDLVALMDRSLQQGDLIDVAIMLGPSGIAPPEMESATRMQV